MKAIIMTGLLALVLVLVVFPQVIAEEATLCEDIESSNESPACIDSVIAPAPIQETNETVTPAQLRRARWQIWFTFNKERKAERQLQLAEMELIRARMAALKNDSKTLQQALKNHEDLLEKVRNVVQNRREKNTEEGINQTATWLTGIDRAIEVHENKIARLNFLILEGTNLTEEQISLIQEKINKTEANIEHLKEVQTQQGERIKTKFMAMENLTEEQVESKLNQIRNRIRNPHSPENEDEDYYSCKEDNDCVKVKDGCCGCGSGGKATAVNKSLKENWEDDIEPCVCPAVESNDWTCVSAEPKCVRGKCKLV
ncbi:MAG TPA: hypothetical protein PLK34_00055 [Candidatus Pacearchaeota archaeon]|nr:hypothetical protein [Candidatus Pacearchaeota archaeon]